MRSLKHQQGALMIEILVTLAITVIGLYGLMEVQTHLQKSEMESYQRTQALILLDGLYDRIETNRAEAELYVTSDLEPAFVGAGMDCPADPANTAEEDLQEWCLALKGSGETQGGTNVGAMLGGRACVEPIGIGTGQYMITLAWQGMTPLVAPPPEVTCGAGQYEQDDVGCTDDLCRRYVTTMVRMATLL